MRKAFACLLTVGLLLLSGGEAQAQKGKSYSSGSSSKPASSSSSSSSRPASSGSSPVGKSYSTGSSAQPSKAPPVVSSPPANQPSGKQYSTGAPPKQPTTPPVANNTPGKQYSTGSPPPASPSGDPNSRKPSGSGYNNAMANDAKHVESQKRYEAATTPKSTYTSKGPDGKTVETPIQANNPQVQTVRRYVTHERYVTYDNRATVFYGGYYSHPVYYHDPFSPFLMGWILSDAINSHDRAVWMYHHQNDMDQARYAEMLRRDARLQAEIDQLKAQNVARDAGYIPPQMRDNPDLMYNKEFVNASYNPQEVPTNTPPAASGGGSAGKVFFWLFIIIVVLVVGGIVIYFLCVKEY